MDKFSLTELQKFILHIMYGMDLFPSSKPIMTSKVIGEIISTAGIYFSDSISEYIEALYAMAQPWNIDVPLIECHGYIGSPEYKEYWCSGAASPHYTEIVLTIDGVRYVESHNLQAFHLSC